MTERSRSGASLIFALGVATLAAVLQPSCLERRDASRDDALAKRCASCHGDAERPGDYLARSAPPRDVAGQDRPVFPGVGAHATHLRESETHAAVACSECHIVPDSVDAPGHADDPRPAELVFGELARAHDRAPRYDAAVRSCRDSYCHGDARPLWTEPKREACGTCHGLPPPAPHPASERCFACHGEVIDEERRFIHPERHVDGVVDYVASECQTCHGGPDNAAPPRDTYGNRSLEALGVGAHQAHLSGGRSSRPLACTECHVVPDEVEDPTHVDAPPAEVRMRGVALRHGHVSTWSHDSATCTNSWCHAPSPNDTRSSPVWTSSGGTDCQTCHGSPPPAPHPQMTDCATCHAGVAAEGRLGIEDRSRHVDGVVDVDVPTDCASCHGDRNAAPPRDVAGNTSTQSPGVGAHQAHVVGSGRARPVPCAECHTVPKDVLAAGHVDSARPAEVVFSGAAVAQGATPVYADGSCAGTPCHGAVFKPSRPWGGTNTEPRWTTVDGTQASCGSCHGLPPPYPHPLPSFPCHECHQNLSADDTTFLHPETHVDGQVTFRVP